MGLFGQKQPKVDVSFMYSVVTDPFVKDLELKVNKNIADGWVPQGGVTEVTGSMGKLFAQAMVRRELLATRDA